MSYGSDLADVYHRAAAYVDRILKGADWGLILVVKKLLRFEGRAHPCATNLKRQLGGRCGIPSFSAGVTAVLARRGVRLPMNLLPDRGIGPWSRVRGPLFDR
jgi:hypothetical protein